MDWIFEKIGDWYDGLGEATRFIIEWVIGCIGIAITIVSIVLPICLSIRLHSGWWLLLWCIPISFFATIMDD